MACKSKTDFPISLETLETDLARVFDHFETAFKLARFEKRYTIARTEYLVRSDNPQYLDLTDKALASDDGNTSHAASILVGVAGVNGMPNIVWGSDGYKERWLEAALLKTRYRANWFTHSDFWQLFDRSTQRGYQIMYAETGYPQWEPGSPLKNLLSWSLSKENAALTHAGTLAVNGDGILLTGAGGSGKSGTVLAGMLAGLQTVGDDYVLVNSDEMKAYPLFKTLKQDPEGLSRLGLSNHPRISMETNWQNKHQFYWEDIGQSVSSDPIKLHAVVCPAIKSQRTTTFEPLSPKDAFLSLIPSGIIQIPGDRALLAKVAARVSRELPCYRLNLGRDQAEISKTIGAFIAEIAA